MYKSEQMASELFTSHGKRKYLTAKEQEQFILTASQQERAEVRAFALTLAYTGCRVSEALELPRTHCPFGQGYYVQDIETAGEG